MRELSRRQVEILREVAAGKSNQQIGEEQNYSKETIAFQMRSILLHLAAATRAEAVFRAYEEGYVERWKALGWWALWQRGS